MLCPPRYDDSKRPTNTVVGFVLCLLLTLGAIFTSSQAQALPANFQMETLISGLTQPVYLAELPDGRMLVGTKGGHMRCHTLPV